MSAILFKISPSMRDFYSILPCTIAQNVVSTGSTTAGACACLVPELVWVPELVEGTRTNGIPRSYSPFTTFRVTLTPRLKLIRTR